MIHVASVTDDHFAPDCAVMLASLVRTHPASDLHVHLFHDASLTAANLSLLRQIVIDAGVCFDAVGLDEAQASGLANTPRFTLRTWYRLLIPEILPQLSRILYLDADTYINGPLDDLWHTDLGNCLLGAVTNQLDDQLVPRIRDELGVDPRIYFNAGVLLIDADAWRREQVSDAVLAFARANPGLDMLDQDALNCVLGPRHLNLHPRWNAMPALWGASPSELPYPPNEAESAARDPAIVHFLGPYKPWHYRSRHPFRQTWFAQLDDTPFAGRVIEGRSLAQIILRVLPQRFALRVEMRLSKTWRLLRRGGTRPRI